MRCSEVGVHRLFHRSHRDGDRIQTVLVGLGDLLRNGPCALDAFGVLGDLGPDGGSFVEVGMASEGSQGGDPA